MGKHVSAHARFEFEADGPSDYAALFGCVLIVAALLIGVFGYLVLPSLASNGALLPGLALVFVVGVALLGLGILGERRSEA